MRAPTITRQVAEATRIYPADRAGSAPCRRRLRQLARQQLKAHRKANGNHKAIVGVDEDGVMLLDFGPVRAVPKE